jgi:hypothetical protein
MPVRSSGIDAESEGVTHERQESGSAKGKKCRDEGSEGRTRTKQALRAIFSMVSEQGSADQGLCFDPSQAKKGKVSKCNTPQLASGPKAYCPSLSSTTQS